jgi:CRISPR-associated protein Cas2
MIVVSMTNCPPSLRGDLSKWLFELNTGVYVGQLGSRIRDELWQRICDNLRTGCATMVFSTDGEQHMDFRVYNTSWEPVDFDGLKLMRRPLPDTLVQPTGINLRPGFSNAAVSQMIKHTEILRNKPLSEYVVIDLETTGLRPGYDEIVEFGAIKITNNKTAAEFSALVKTSMKIPETVVELTGLTQNEINEKGRDIESVLRDFLNFIGNMRIVTYNAAFDSSFIRSSCRTYGFEFPRNQYYDILQLARRKIDGVENYRLSTLAQYFHLGIKQIHRALDDCKLAFEVFTKLNEFQ